MTTLSEPIDPLTLSERDPYRVVVLALVAASFGGVVLALGAGIMWGNRVLLDLGATFVLAGLALLEVAMRRRARAPSAEDDSLAASLERLGAAAVEEATRPAPANIVVSRLTAMAAIARQRVAGFGTRALRADTAGVRIAAAGIGITAFIIFFSRPLVALSSQLAAEGAGTCLAAAALAAVATRYLTGIDDREFPGSSGMARGGRVMAWLLVVAAASIGLAWLGQESVIRGIHVVLIAINVILCYELASYRPAVAELELFPPDLGVLSALGSRPNILGSLLDAAERQLGIDLRSTWALTVVRSSIEPLIVGLVMLGWASTAFTVVGPDEQALVERFGVSVAGAPLAPGLHLHWPWPVDQVFRIPMQRIQILTVGHEGEETAGPEDVLWAREHAANEYTLLLGNGRDLVTIDAGVQFRILDARAWRYHSQNPADALKAIAYRTVMRNTVNHTLAEVLSENVITMTQLMRRQVQQDADGMGLGVQVLSFTLGGMHPPVAVAADYEAVNSAELGKVTAVADAHSYSNGVVPMAQSTVIVRTNRARADDLNAQAKATGEAASFLVLQTQYQSDTREYMFRRRLEQLEKDLIGRTFTIVDTRIQRDGGELWVTP